MKKFLSVALKFQWKTIFIIFALLIIQTFFQMEIIDLFSAALSGVKNQKIDLLFKSGLCMVVYTAFVMISIYDAENDEVCAFEELIGSHGGVGGSQSEPFILYPSEWNVPDDEIVGAENIYRILKENLKNIKGSAETEMIQKK